MKIEIWEDEVLHTMVDAVMKLLIVKKFRPPLSQQPKMIESESRPIDFPSVGGAAVYGQTLHFSDGKMIFNLSETDLPNELTIADILNRKLIERK